MGGLIRFVGGPWHNQRNYIQEWIPWLDIIEPIKCSFAELDQLRDFKRELIRYRLVALWKGHPNTRGRTMFYEYHLDSLTEEEAMELRGGKVQDE